MVGGFEDVVSDAELMMRGVGTGLSLWRVLVRRLGVPGKWRRAEDGGCLGWHVRRS